MLVSKGTNMFLQFKPKDCCGTTRYIGYCPKCHNDFLLDYKIFKENPEYLFCSTCSDKWTISSTKFTKYGLRIGIIYGPTGYYGRNKAGG